LDLSKKKPYLHDFAEDGVAAADVY